MGTVLIPTDGSPGTEQVIDHGVAIANQFDGTVHGLYAVHLEPKADFDLAFDTTTVKETKKSEVTPRLTRSNGSARR